jgi:hypothetical protein
MRAKAYQGILMDLITNMKSSREEKNAAKQILDNFPLVQLKLENETGIIRTISFGSSSESETLADFINKECRIFTPRTIRLSTRKGIHFNAIMSKDVGIQRNYGCISRRLLFVFSSGLGIHKHSLVYY